MLVRTRTALAATLLMSVLPGACSKRDLVVGDTGIGLIDGGPLDTRTVDGPVGGASGTDGAIMQPPVDAGASACASTTVLLPWTESSSTAAMRLEIATTNTAIAVMNRQADQLDVRTYARDGSVIKGFQFASDTRLLPYRDGRFLLVSRGQTGDLVATAIDPDLVGSTRLYATATKLTEHIVGAIALPTTVIAITDHGFSNLATGTTVPWNVIWPGQEVFGGPFPTGFPFGLATDGNRVLMAWGYKTDLDLALLDASGTLIAFAEELKFLDFPAQQQPTAIPYANGLLMFDKNSVRATKIGFDLTRTVIGTNTQLRTFAGTVPKVAAIVLQGRPIAFWLTVFPATDNSQESAPHHLYGCELDLAAPASCLRTAPIASTNFTGSGIAQEPVAAAAFPDGSGFAIAHTDTTGHSWLHVADLSCANPPAP